MTGGCDTLQPGTVLREPSNIAPDPIEMTMDPSAGARNKAGVENM